MTKLEQLTKKIYDECLADGEPVSMEEAKEMAEMELGAKEIKHYEQSAQPKEKKKREVKLDEEKVEIIKALDEILADADLDLSDIKIINPQKEIAFRIGENDYSLSLIKHRKKKG